MGSVQKNGHTAFQGAKSAAAANPCVSGLVAGLPLQFCALAQKGNGRARTRLQSTLPLLIRAFRASLRASRCSFALSPANGPKRQQSGSVASLRVSGLVLGLPLQFCALAGRRPKTATGEPERGSRAGLAVSLPLQFCGPRSGPPAAVLRAGRQPRRKSVRSMGEPERGSRAPNQRFTVAPVANPRRSKKPRDLLRFRHLLPPCALHSLLSRTMLSFASLKFCSRGLNQMEALIQFDVVFSHS